LRSSFFGIGFCCKAQAARSAEWGLTWGAELRFIGGSKGKEIP
jgi:hypothetical protein